MVEDAERAIYRTYLDEVAPLIAAIEVYDNEFPAEVLNEVRSIFTHFARCRITDDSDVAADNMVKAERHLKRLRFDCYKYAASMHSIRVGELIESFSPKVLAGVNDGKFLTEVNRLIREADDLVIAAKTNETLGNEDVALNSYKESVGKYGELVEYVDASKEALMHAQGLYGAYEEDMRKSGNRGFVVGIIGVIVGIIGAAFGAVSLMGGIA